MFSRIFVPLDGGELGGRTLPLADRLSDLWDAELVVGSFLLAHESADAQQETIQRQVEGLRHRPRKTVIRPVVFTVADEIADELEAEADALVVMATRARPHTAPVVGSVAEEILAYTNGPVLLMGPHSEAGDRWPTGPMIVCTDGSATAEAIISAAGRWSSGLELPLSVVTVTRLEDAGRLHGSETSALEVVSRMAAKLADKSEQQVTEEVLFHRDPAAAIVEYARATHAALIAMATHGATGLRRIAMGSVAMGVVHQAPCPVLITQP